MPSSIEGLLLAGRYRLGQALGSGGMSVVYEAEDLRLSRRVAVKLLKAGGAEPALAERLFREAKAAARAEHPAVITVYGYGSDDETGLDYLVMERLEGESLAARIARDAPLDVAWVVRLGAELADALAHVHAAGVIHRDLKPANVFLARRGLRVDELKLLDFGIARQLDLHTLTAPGQVLGTLRYMAPEQLRDPKRIDARADLYALGVLLFECLCGRLPDDVGTGAELGRPELWTHARAVPPALQVIVSRCLALDPSDRFADGRHVCDLLLALREPR